jgi:phosphopantetheinyl transferase (holo-ACP synthase)
VIGSAEHGLPPPAPHRRIEVARGHFRSLAAPHVLASLRHAQPPPAGSPGHESDYAAGAHAIEALLRDDGFPAGAHSDLAWRRDALGKPFVEWSGRVAEWARERGFASNCLHVSNSHDGGAHLVLAAYGEGLAGIGIDAVWLPRLRSRGKDRRYLLRFARRFMSPREWAAFEREIDSPDHPFPLSRAGALPLPEPDSAAGLVRETEVGGYPNEQDGAAGQVREIGLGGEPSETDSAAGYVVCAAPGDDPDELLRQRVAAHFSLMEAASKACGTGLKVGVGMGRATSLPMHSLGAATLSPEVELLFGPEAELRLRALNAERAEACVQSDGEFLVSAVLLYRGDAEAT